LELIPSTDETTKSFDVNTVPDFGDPVLEVGFDTVKSFDGNWHVRIRGGTNPESWRGPKRQLTTPENSPADLGTNLGTETVTDRSDRDQPFPKCLLTP
jgi:hypothetical protein